MLRTFRSLGFIVLLSTLSVSAQIRIDLPFLQINVANVREQEIDDNSLSLLIAADSGDLDSVLVLLEKGVDVNKTTEEGVSALMYAATGGYPEITRILVENGADINAVPDNGITALAGASINNNYEVAVFLLQNGADTEIADINQVTPLMWAVAYDLFEITELLMMFGANPMHTDLEGVTPLHAAAIYAQPDIAWLLIDYGAGINNRDNFGFTPLMMAVQIGREEMADYLLFNNASINVKTKDGLSALALAIANNQPGIARRLIELGADPFEKISYTDNLMNLARWQGNQELISLVAQYRVRPNLLPDFSTLRLSGNFMVNTGDFFNGLIASLEDDKYNLRIEAGWSARPVRRAILVEFEQGWYDQLWEQRHLFFGRLLMDFPIRYSLGINEDGIYAGLALLYSSGRYWGTYSYPDPVWHVSAGAGYFKRGSWWFYDIGYEYLNLNIHEKPAHWIKFGAGIRIRIKSDPVIYRTTYW